MDGTTEVLLAAGGLVVIGGIIFLGHSSPALGVPAAKAPNGNTLNQVKAAVGTAVATVQTAASTANGAVAAFNSLTGNSSGASNTDSEDPQADDSTLDADASDGDDAGGDLDAYA
jgi:hypothetical protein